MWGPTTSFSGGGAPRGGTRPRAGPRAGAAPPAGPSPRYPPSIGAPPGGLPGDHEEPCCPRLLVDHVLLHLRVGIPFRLLSSVRPGHRDLHRPHGVDLHVPRGRQRSLPDPVRAPVRPVRETGSLHPRREPAVRPLHHGGGPGGHAHPAARPPP